MQLSTLGRLAWALKAEEAVLLALAPDGGDAIRGIAASGDGPTTRQLELILRKRPRDQVPGDHDPASEARSSSG